MGILKLIKKFFSGTEYYIDRDILINYVYETIEFAVNERLSFCDEFFLLPDKSSDGLHVIIINYDVPCKNPLESEKSFSGIVIFINNGSQYNPEKDEKFYTIQELISVKLSSYPEKFVMRNDFAEPASLENYKIEEW